MMKKNEKLTRRGVLSGAMASVGTALAAQAPLISLRPVARAGDVPAGDGGPARPQDRIRARTTLDTIIADAGLGGVTAVVIADADTGVILEQREGATPMLPASTTKSMTALYALDALGADHRFATVLTGTGTLTGGVLSGDLVLVGGDDPTLDTDGLADLAERLSAAGVREVRGDFRVWGGTEIFEIDPAQLPHIGYNPAVSSLNLNYNRVHFEWKREAGRYSVGMDARTETQRPAVGTSTMRVADRSQPVYTYEDQTDGAGGGIDAWTVAREALGTGGTRWLPVRRPALYAGDVFRTVARARGIVLKAPRMAARLPGGIELARVESAPLSRIIRDMLLYSTNLTAEVIGRAATRARVGGAVTRVPEEEVATRAQGASVTTLAASAQAMNGWLAARYGVRCAFVDHSGLGEASRISAGDMARVLIAARNEGQLRPLMRTIPMVDADRAALPNPPGAVVAKTGTLNFVSALAGYLRTTQGADLVFVILSAEESRRAAARGSPDEAPAGTWEWNADAKRMQQRLLQRWARVFSG